MTKELENDLLKKQTEKTGDDTIDKQVSGFTVFPTKEWIDSYYENNPLTLPNNLKYLAVTKEMTEKYMEETSKDYYIEKLEGIINKIITACGKNGIQFSEDCEGALDFEELGQLSTGWEEDDYATFDEWSPTEEEVNLLKKIWGKHVEEYNAKKQT